MSIRIVHIGFRCGSLVRCAGHGMIANEVTCVRPEIKRSAREGSVDTDGDLSTRPTSSRCPRHVEDLASLESAEL